MGKIGQYNLYTRHLIQLLLMNLVINASVIDDESPGTWTWSITEQAFIESPLCPAVS